MMPRRTASIGVTIPGLDWKVRALAVAAPKAVDRGLERGIRAATIDIEGQVKRYLEGIVLKRRTGRLWRSIHADTFRRLGRVVGIVGTNVKYAAIHEFGGIIRPKKEGGLLVFSQGRRNEKTGRFQRDVIFAKSVKIPARPYMSRAFAARKAIVGRLIMRSVMSELTGVGRPNAGAVFPPAGRKAVGFDA
jgi:phage gpG-like protein